MTSTATDSEIGLMWAYSLVEPGRFNGVKVPAPHAQDLVRTHVLLRTLVGGICGSDLPAFRGTVAAPHVEPAATAAPPGWPMHEVVGEVVASADSSFAAGDIVVGWADRCNAIAEYVVADGAGLITYDQQWPPHIAVMLQPLACVLYAVDRLSGIADSDVVVLGQGPIGALFSHVLKSEGARSVTGVDQVDRGDIAETFGIDEMVHSTTSAWVDTLPAGDRRPLVIEAIGHNPDVLRDAVSAAADGGTIFYFGIPDNDSYPLNIDTLVRRDLTLIGGLTRDRRRALNNAAGYLTRHPELAESFITTVLPMSQVQNAFARAARPQRGQLKIAVTASS